MEDKLLVLRLTAIVILLLAGLLASSHYVNNIGIVSAEEDEYEYEGGDNEVEADDLAEGAGSLAWTGGLVATAAFVVYKHAYPRLVKAGIKPPLNMRVALNLHIIISIVLGLVALYHAYVLRAYAGPIEYVAVGLILVLLISGLTLRYVKNRYVKIFSRVIHAQRLLSILLIIAILVHTATIGE